MSNQYTAEEVLGFSSIVVAALDTGVDHPNRITTGINAAAADLGIKADRPSDDLDASRDLIIDEAVGRGGLWKVIDKTLYVGLDGFTPEDVVELDKEES